MVASRSFTRMFFKSGSLCQGRGGGSSTEVKGKSGLGTVLGCVSKFTEASEELARQAGQFKRQPCHGVLPRAQLRIRVCLRRLEYLDVELAGARLVGIQRSSLLLRCVVGCLTHS